MPSAHNKVKNMSMLNNICLLFLYLNLILKTLVEMILYLSSALSAMHPGSFNNRRIENISNGNLR